MKEGGMDEREVEREVEIEWCRKEELLKYRWSGICNRFGYFLLCNAMSFLIESINY